MMMGHTGSSSSSSSSKNDGDEEVLFPVGTRIRAHHADSDEWFEGVVNVSRSWCGVKKDWFYSTELDSDSAMIIIHGYGTEFMVRIHTVDVWEDIMLDEFSKVSLSQAQSKDDEKFFYQEFMRIKTSHGVRHVVYMSDSFVTRLGPLLGKGRIFKDVHLSGLNSYRLGKDAFKSLVSGLVSSPSTEELRIGDFRCGNHKDEEMDRLRVEHISRLLPLNMSVRYFGLRESFLPCPKTLEELFSGKLRELRLGKIEDVKDGRAAALESGLRRNQSLMSVDLFRCSREIAHACLRGLRAHVALSTLTLRFQDLDVNGAQLVGDILASPNTLEKLILPGWQKNPLPESGYEAIANGLRQCNALLELNIYIHETSADLPRLALILSALQKRNTIQCLKLEGGIINESGLSPKQAETLLHHLVRLKNLRRVEVDNGFSPRQDSVLEPLWTGLEKHLFLEHFSGWRSWELTPARSKVRSDCRTNQHMNRIIEIQRSLPTKLLPQCFAELSHKPRALYKVLQHLDPNAWTRITTNDSS